MFQILELKEAGLTNTYPATFQHLYNTSRTSMANPAHLQHFPMFKLKLFKFLSSYEFRTAGLQLTLSDLAQSSEFWVNNFRLRHLKLNFERLERNLLLTGSVLRA